MKFRSKPTARCSALFAIASLATLQAADITLGTGTYTDTQTYNNGAISGPVTFGSGASYTFDSLNLPLAWNRVILNSGAALAVSGNINVDFSGLSLNGGTLTAGGLLLHDSPNWAGSINDGKQSIEQGDTIINGATLVANQSNANFISFIGSVSNPQWNVHLANNVWIGSDGATINSNGHDIGISMALGNHVTPEGRLTKTGAGTLTLSATTATPPAPPSTVACLKSPDQAPATATSAEPRPSTAARNSASPAAMAPASASTAATGWMSSTSTADW